MSFIFLLQPQISVLGLYEMDQYDTKAEGFVYVVMFVVLQFFPYRTVTWHQNVLGFQGAMCPVSGPELESLLSCIRDLLPDLGEGFLLACLQEYGYNSELVINNILEDRLAPSLDKLDRTTPRYGLLRLQQHPLGGNTPPY